MCDKHPVQACVSPVFSIFIDPFVVWLCGVNASDLIKHRMYAQNSITQFGHIVSEANFILSVEFDVAGLFASTESSTAHQIGASLAK